VTKKSHHYSQEETQPQLVSHPSNGSADTTYNENDASVNF